METDSYWRTRCVGEAIDQGYTFLRLTRSCGRITDFPFPLLLRRRDVSRDTFIGNIGFRCQKCGGTRRSSGSIPKGTPRAFPTTPVSRDPGWVETGVSKAAWGHWGRSEVPPSPREQFLGSRRVPRLIVRLDSAASFARFSGP